MTNQKPINTYKNCPFYNRITSVPAGFYIVATPVEDHLGDYVNPAGEFFVLELSDDYKEGAILGTLEDAIEKLDLIKYEKIKKKSKNF